MTRFALIATAATLAGLTVSAHADQPKRPPLFQAVIDCKAMADPAQRLACYDSAVAALDSADLSGQVVVVDRDQARAVRRQAFGFTLPSLAIFERGEKEPEINNLSTTLVRAKLDPLQRWVFEIEGGAVWKQTENATLARNPKPGMKIDIKKGALGAYFMNVDGQRAIKVERVK